MNVKHYNLLFTLLAIAFPPHYASGAESSLGKLTPFEREILQFDKNKDGKLSKEERTEYLAAQAKQREDHMKKWDKNGDGKLDEEEASEAQASAKKALAQARRAEVETKVREKKEAASASKK